MACPIVSHASGYLVDNLDKEIKNVEAQLEQMQTQAELENKFAEQGNKKFEKNLLAFKHYFPDIYEKFLHHQPSDKFNLFVNPNGTGNIVDYDTSVAMYGEDPEAQTHEQVEKSFLDPEIGRIDHSSLAKLDNAVNFSHVELMQALGDSYNDIKANLPPNELVNSKIPSMVIFGVGLGYHLSLLINKTTATYINIFEPNEDYFFASLFCFDWAEFLAKIDSDGSFLYLGVGVPENEVYETIYRRSQMLGAFSISNSFFYQHYPSQSVGKLIEEFKTNFNQFFMGWGFFDDALMSVAHSVKLMKKPVSMIKNEKQRHQFSDFPIFVVANGPSLDQDIERIKELKDTAIIVACNSASTALIKYGVVPDFHVALERSKATYDFLSEVVSQEDRDKINLLVLNVMYPDVADLFGWTGVAMKGSEAGAVLLQLGELVRGKQPTSALPFSNPLVGNTALSYMASLQFKDIYLFGADNGYVDENHHHSKASFYYNDSGETVYQPIQIGDKVTVPGNFGGTVISDHFMYTGKEQMDRLVELYKPQGLNCYNCSNGAKIEGAYPLHSKDIVLQVEQDKSQVIDYIKQQLFIPVDTEVDHKELLDFEAFEHICKTMVEILDTEVSNRGEALDTLMESLRYLYSFKAETRYLHLFLLIEGEALYVTSTLLGGLYNFGDDEEVIPYYMALLEHWKSFLRSAPTMYRERWDVLSDHDWKK